MNFNKFLDKYSYINRCYHYEESDGTGFLKFPAFSQAGIVNHGFSTRTGGVSAGAYASLNLSFTRPDELRENVIENFRRFASAANINYEQMVMDNFEHSTNIIIVDDGHCGMGYIAPPLPFCDGLITKSENVALITGHADCVPLYLLDTKKHVIGLAHAGWKGTLGKIGTIMANMLINEFGSNPNDMLSGIGPCICKECFEVDLELAERFQAEYPGVPLYSNGKIGGKAQLDLNMASAAQFLEAGLPPENICMMDICTFENPELFYSHRYNKGNTGGMAAYIELTSPTTNAFLSCPTVAKII